jgi:hypothetical protein
MYTAVMGRRIEIGMLNAVGAPKGTLRGTFIGEACCARYATCHQAKDHFDLKGEVALHIRYVEK